MAERAALSASALLLVAACSEAQPPEPPREKLRPKAETQRSLPASERAGAAATPAPESEAAADVLRRYYDHIENRRYGDAHALREARPGDDLDAFAAHFDRFATHDATIGKASEPVAAGDWLYVELPVHAYGTLKDGSPFGSAGTITLRRAKRGGSWRIYTKG